MSVNLSMLAGAGWQFFDNDGVVLSGGKLYTYQAGTTTPAVTYTTSAGNIQNSNPIILNAYGRLPQEVWLTSTDSYKFVLNTSADTLLWTHDNIYGAATPSQITDLLADLASTTNNSKGDALIGFKQSTNTGFLTGAVGKTVSQKFQEMVSVKDFGAVGDGTTDDTSAVNLAIAWLNSANGLGITFPPGSYVCGILNAITSSNATIVGNSAVVLSKPNTLVSNNQSMFTVSGNGFTATGVVFNGNQANYGSGTGCQLFTLSGSGHKLHRCQFINSPGRGAILNCSESEFVDCNFNNNANLGHESVAASYLKFIGCTWNVNGCGFQQTRTVPADNGSFAAFGHALRYRSHHIEFIDCEAKLNGRDGMYCGEGCYSIKYQACLAWANNDGGFTLNADFLGTGLPGDGEPCYDVEYVDCEAYDNYNSGLFTTASITNLSVIGGRYYNNHRLAGSLPNAAGYPNGIYIAGGSSGTWIQGAKAYDERQYRLVTNGVVSGATCTVTATGWVPGTKDYYPKVAFIAGSTGAFLGYAEIVSETVGSVTVKTLPYDGMVLSTINNTMYVTQRVQHNGIFFDNGTLGYCNADTFGETNGPVPSIEGFKVLIGTFANGQNVIVDNGVEKLEPELLVNPTFDADILNWTFNLPGGGTATRITSGIQKSTASLRLVGGSSAANGDADLVANALDHLVGSYFRYGMWVYGSSRADATLQFFWTISGSTFSTSTAHPGGGWRYLMVAGYVPDGATAVVARILATAGKTTYWDTGSLRAYALKTDSRDLDPNSRSLPT